MGLLARLSAAKTMRSNSMGDAMRRVLVCVALCAAATARAQSPDLRGPPDIAAVKDNGVELGIATSKVEVTTQTNLVAVLESRGMRVDGDVFALVYELNPGLVLPVHARTQLLLPLLQEGDKPCSRPCRGSVTAFMNAKKRSIEDLTELERLTSKVADRPDLGLDPAQKERLKQLSHTFHALAAAMEGHKFALSRRFVTQTARIVSGCRERLAPRLGKLRSLSPDDKRWLLAAFDDLEARLACCVTTTSPGQVPANSDIRVRVRTLRKGAEVPHLRVIAAPAGLADEIDLQTPFPRQSSPTEDALPAARYLVWAVEPNSSSLVSERLTVTVAHGVQTPIVVDLELTRP